jgi:hypothetical protein
VYNSIGLYIPSVEYVFFFFAVLSLGAGLALNVYDGTRLNQRVLENKVPISTMYGHGSSREDYMDRLVENECE